MRNGNDINVIVKLLPIWMFQELSFWEERESQMYHGTISEEYENRLMLITMLANKTLEERMQLGHQLEEMLISCEWRGYPCTPQ